MPLAVLLERCGQGCWRGVAGCIDRGCGRMASLAVSLMSLDHDVAGASGTVSRTTDGI